MTFKRFQESKQITCSFCQHDDTISLFLSTLVNVFENSILAIKIIVEFRNKTHVHTARSKTWSHSNKSCFLTHETNQTYSILVRSRFNPSTFDDSLCFFDAALISKWLINYRNIIINATRDVANSYVEFSLPYFIIKFKYILHTLFIFWKICLINKIIFY